jgi:hypothetical protein
MDPRLLSPGEEVVPFVPFECTDDLLRPAMKGSSIDIDMFRFGGVASKMPALPRREEGFRGEGRAREARRGLSGSMIDVRGIDLEKLDRSNDDRKGPSRDIR